MAGGVITAAWVQALPLWFAGAVAAFGLSTWHKQIRGQRLVEHSEKALLAGIKSIRLLRYARRVPASIQMDALNDTERDSNVVAEERYNCVSTRLSKALLSIIEFQGYYDFKRSYTPGVSPMRNIGNEMYKCHDSIEDACRDANFLESSQYLHEDDEDTPGNLEDALRRLHGFKSKIESDVIGAQINSVESALMDELGSVLRPRTVMDLFRNWFKINLSFRE